ncbi:MAG: type IV secretion protein Rhs [Anaerolineales bacterium]|nr:type IV secretion protein Rhs [Anaerolineales bacterium]
MRQLTTLPNVIIEAQGITLPREDTLGLEKVRVQQRLSLPTLCELSFSDPPGPLPLSSSLEPGTTLRVLISGHQEPLFVGQVTAVEHVYGPANQRQVFVRGYDLLHSLRKRQSIVAHVQVTPHDLARELVADIGLTVQSEETGPFWHQIIQHHQSDFELLNEVAERSGLFLTIRENTLHLITLNGMDEPLPLDLGDTLFEVRIEVNGDPALRTVTAMGWDPLLVEVREGQASSTRVGRQVSAEVSPNRLGGSGSRTFLDEVAQHDLHVESIAQNELDLQFNREVTLWGMAEGDPRLRPGARVSIDGVADPIKGRYVLTSVNHIIDERKGFMSEISTEPPHHRVRSKSAGATFGIVTQVDDPESLGRVKVSLPTYGDVETEWMGVLSMGAGSEKGLVILPDVGDRVLVLLVNGDPGQGVVLGGLYGTQGPPDSGVLNGAVRRFTFLTPQGQRILVDDAEDMIRLENSDGSFVELAPGVVRLHSSTDLEIEAPGQSVTIRGSTVDFERA